VLLQIDPMLLDQILNGLGSRSENTVIFVKCLLVNGYIVQTGASVKNEERLDIVTALYTILVNSAKTIFTLNY
jgi:hypothetical protein